jgi:hypothetical protein
VAFHANPAAASIGARARRPAGGRSRYSFLNTRAKSFLAYQVCHAGIAGGSPSAGESRSSASGTGRSTRSTICHATARRAVIEASSSAARAASPRSGAYGAAAPMILRSWIVDALARAPSRHAAVLSTASPWTSLSPHPDAASTAARTAETSEARGTGLPSYTRPRLARGGQILQPAFATARRIDSSTDLHEVAVEVLRSSGVLAQLALR